MKKITQKTNKTEIFKNILFLFSVVMMSLSTSLFANELKVKSINEPITCNSINPIPMVNGDFDGLTTSSNTTGLCILGCGISNVSRLIDSDLNNYARASTTVGVGVNHTLRVTDGNDTFVAGTFAGYRISPVGGLSVDLLNNISIKTYLGGILKETYSGSSLVSISLLANPGNYIIGFNSTQNFDAIEISINSLITAVSTTNIYYPIITTYCAGPDLECNVPTAMNYPLFPTTIQTNHTGLSGIGVGSVTNTENVLTSNPNDFAAINLLVGVAGSGSLAVKDQVTNYPAGTYAGFEIENSNLVGIAALGNLTITTYLDGVVKEYFSGNNLLVNGDLLSSGGKYKVGFVSSMDFDEVQLSVNQTIGVNLGTTKVYNAVFEKFCAGPDLICNTPTALTTPIYPVFINGANTGVNGVLCVACAVTNGENLIDTNPNNYAIIDLTATVGTNASIAVKEQITDYPAGNFAGFDIENIGLLNVNALNAITVTTYLNGNPQEAKSGNGALVSVGTNLLVATGRSKIGFTTTLPFDEVKITLNNTATVTLGTTKVYNAVFEKFCAGPDLICNTPTALTTPIYPVFINGANTGINGVLCVACAVTNAENLIDTNPNNYAIIDLTATVGTNASIAVKEQITDYPAGNFAGFDIENLGLLNVNALNAITVTTYLNRNPQEAKSGSGALVSVGTDLLVTTGRTTIGFTTTLPFDEVKLTLNNTATVSLGTTKVYSALFEKLCMPTVLCNESYALTNPDFPVTINSDRSGISDVACVACAVNNSKNVLTETTTDFAKITLTAGVLATGSISVLDHLFTYPNGTFAGFTIKDLNYLVELNLFQSLTISTYNNGVLQQSKTGGQLIGLSLLTPILGSGPGFYNVGFKTNLPFDEIRITVGSLASVITNINVYGAFVNTNNSNDGGSGSLNCVSSDLSVLKTVSETTPKIGSNVTFTITATNAGPSDATAVVVNDVLPTGYTYISSAASIGIYNNATGIWNIGDLSYNSNAVLTITATVNATGNYTNTATISGTEPDPDSANNTSSVIPTPINAILANDDTATSVDGSIGGTVFTNVLTNDTLNGQPVLASEVTTTFVSSTHPNITLSGTNVLVAPGTPAGNYTLIYQICEKSNPGNCDTAIVSVIVSTPSAPSISITKDGNYFDNNGDGKTNIGDTVVYNFVVTNTGNVTLSNISVTDDNAVVSGGPLATLAVGASDATTFTAVHTISQTDIDAGIIYNLATATGHDPSNNPITGISTDPTLCTTCPIDATCPTCTITELTTAPSISITKDGNYFDNNGDGKTNIGDTIVYNFVVTNTGNVTLSNISITDDNALVSGGPLATLAVGASDATTFTAVHTISQTDIDAGIIYNLATATGHDPSNNPITGISTDPTPCTTCPVDPTCPTCTITELTTAPSISITKDGNYFDNNGDGKTNIGDTVVYNFVVTNTGNVTLKDISVTDDNAVVSGGPLATLAVGASDATTFTAVHTISQTDIDAGIIYNLATATGHDPSNNPITGISTDPTPCTTCPVDPTCPTCTITELTTAPSISITKDGNYFDNNGDGKTNIGDTVVYNFVVTNTGNVTLKDISVTDDNALVSGGPLATLAVGASDATTFTAVHTISQTDIDAGIIYNLATATGHDPKDNPITGISTDPTPCTTCPTDPSCPTCTITILKPVIIANNDIGTPTTTVGGIAFANVLINDTLKGQTVIDSEVSISFVSSTSPNITLVGTDVVVAPNTPVGSYILVYQICEKLDPSNCDTASVTIEVVCAQTEQPTIACYESATFNATSCTWDITGTQPVQPTMACYESATFNTTTCTWDITGTQPSQPTMACYESATFNATTCSWDVTGTQPVQPTMACYESAKFNSATCSWDVTGTQPVQPTMACYESATFNSATCSWDVTGTQPVQPPMACYESANFNVTTCSWDITGTQPVQPTMACYESATFNATTCSWDITGTQPVQPTMACYESATFNVTTCSWDITGTQPVQPTMACYESANFNVTTCSWDITGTQPVQPTMACYESAAFNATTCSWDITGTQPTQPTMACYESATFNATTCSWDVTQSSTLAFIEETPANITVECSNVPVVENLTAKDNCGSVTVNYKEETTKGSCAGNYILTRTWTATDTFNNTITTSQTIIVQDTTPPQTMTSFVAEVNTSCDNITEAPQLQFTDPCGTEDSITIVFDESKSDVNSDGTFVITRTWSATDICQNVATYKQIINVSMLNDIKEMTQPVCNNDISISLNLEDIVRAQFPDLMTSTGTWTGDSEGLNTTNGMFNPYQLELGNYNVIYNSNDDPFCPKIVKINIPVNDNCKVLPCGNIIVHNVITRNGDGENEYFDIENITDSCYSDNAVEIYNRWGVKVFDMNNYDNVNRVFVGISEGRTTINQSAELPDGTYFYVLKYKTLDNQNVVKNGYLYISR